MDYKEILTSLVEILSEEQLDVLCLVGELMSGTQLKTKGGTLTMQDLRIELDGFGSLTLEDMVKIYDIHD